MRGANAAAWSTVIATVWFVVGLMNDLLFYYPPILFIVGLVAFIKGLIGEE